MSQLALPLQLADHAVFASFLADGNEALVRTLCGLADGDIDDGCWLWGPVATGKTHLLQAVCERAGDVAAYVPMSAFHDADPEILDGLAARRIVCIDDVDAVLGKARWEVVLFDLCNQIFDAGGQLVLSAAQSSFEGRISLPDLASRLRRLPVFRMQALDEEGRIAALQLRSRYRGLELPDDTARFLLKRSRRDMASLYAALDRLDAASLQAKRRLTIPFVRDVLLSN